MAFSLPGAWLAHSRPLCSRHIPLEKKAKEKQWWTKKHTPRAIFSPRKLWCWPPCHSYCPSHLSKRFCEMGEPTGLLTSFHLWVGTNKTWQTPGLSFTSAQWNGGEETRERETKKGDGKVCEGRLWCKGLVLVCNRKVTSVLAVRLQRLITHKKRNLKEIL